MTFVVECINISKKYKKIQALNNITVNIEENKIYGLLGRNSAGKTTFLDIIAAQSKQTSGQIKVFGKNPYEITQGICYIKDTITEMDFFKIKEILDIASCFFDNWDDGFKNQLIQKFNLDVNKKYKNLSKGMKAAVGIIIGLSSRAPLTIFDESYVGLDAAARQIFYDMLLQDYMQNPRTIIFSTHLIDEVHHVFENIIILDQGNVLLNDVIDNVQSNAYIIEGDAKDVEKVIQDYRVLKKEQFGRVQRIFVFDTLEHENIQLHNLRVKTMTLQELFINLTSEQNKIELNNAN